jgi:hypothetical protein
VKFRLRYEAYIRWVFHKRFNDQDATMVETMHIPPERLYRPDVSIIAWRRLCETARGVSSLPSPLATVHESDVS